MSTSKRYSLRNISPKLGKMSISNAFSVRKPRNEESKLHSPSSSGNMASKEHSISEDNSKKTLPVLGDTMLSPGMVRKFQKMTTASPKKKTSSSRLLRKTKTLFPLNEPQKLVFKDDVVDTVESNTLVLDEDNNPFISSSANPISPLDDCSPKTCNENLQDVDNSNVMTDADMLVVVLPETLNYEIWHDPFLKDDLEKSSIEPTNMETVFPDDHKENQTTAASALLHSKTDHESRALKALEISSFPEYRELKGHFFTGIGKSFIKSTGASSIKLFNKKKVQNDSILKDDMQKEIHTSAKTAKRFSPTWFLQFSKNISTSDRKSAFKPVSSNFTTASSSNSKQKEYAPETPFNTPVIYSKKVNVYVDKLETKIEEKRRLRPRPTRQPTLFGFSSCSELSEDEAHRKESQSSSFKKRRR